jgi:hypothetical protein
MVELSERLVDDDMVEWTDRCDWFFLLRSRRTERPLPPW